MACQGTLRVICWHQPVVLMSGPVVDVAAVITMTVVAEAIAVGIVMAVTYPYGDDRCYGDGGLMAAPKGAPELCAEQILLV